MNHNIFTITFPKYYKFTFAKYLMKKLFFLFIASIAALSCQSQKKQFRADLNPAASEIWTMIEYVEKNAKRAEKGKDYSPLYIHELSNLTGLSAKVIDYNCIVGIMYKPAMADVIRWKNWFGAHSSYISYYENEDINTYIPQVKAIFKVEIAQGEFMYSISKYDIDRFLAYAQEIKSKKTK